MCGALVIADSNHDSPESQHGKNGEPVRAFGAKKFWQVLREECEQAGADVGSPAMARVERAVWNLGSTGHLES